jgi:uncharacterized protein (DUF58 family)
MAVRIYSSRWQQWWQRWLERRAPASRQVRLDQKRIFIFPVAPGFFFIATLAALFLGGINYQNSLILNLCFLLASLFVVTILHTYRNLAGLQLKAGRTGSAFAGDQVACEVILARDNRHQHQAIRLSWHENESALVDVCELEAVPVTLLLDTQYRGWFRPRRIRVESRFPLGLLRAWSWVDLDMVALVYPRPIPVDLASLDQSAPEGEGSQYRRGGMDDFDRLRDYQPGDPLQHVAWKHFARGQGMHTKVFHGYRSDQLWLEWQALPGRDDELKLSQLTYLVLTLARQGRPFGLRIPGCEIAPNVGDAHEVACLRALALYGEEQDPTAIATVEAALI